MMHCCDATGSYFVVKVQGKLFVHFHAVPIKCHIICRTDCMVCHDKFYVKENYEHALDFVLHPSRLFRSR
jgi:hypothetical protein